MRGSLRYTIAYFTSLPNWLTVADSGHGFQMEFVSPLTNAGGTIAISNSIVANTNQEFTLPGGVNLRAINGGSSISAVVPIPAAAWLFGGALGALAWVRRRQAKV